MMHKDEVIIVIGGDVYPKGSIEPYFVNGNAEYIFNDILPIFNAADYTVVNLECPLADQETPILKDGAALRAVTKTVNGLKASGVDAVNLSNNHILDQGGQGLASTINTLTTNEISFFGAGKNLQESKIPHIVTVKGRKIAFLGVAEHEFTIATETSYGANSLNVPNNIRQIKSIRNQVDYIILLYHGGKEHYPYPTPNQQNTSRFFIEEGVDVVIAQHSHIAGCYENYMGKHIVYGQGNFIFEKLSRNYESWFEGVLVQLKFKGKEVDINFVPFEQSKNFIGVKKMSTKKSDALLKKFHKYSENVVDPEFVKAEWKKLCVNELSLYKSRLHGHSRVLRVLNRKINFARWIYPKWKNLMIRNVVECETHREGLETLWKDNEVDF